MPMTGPDMLSWFEVPRPLIEPTLRALRLGNTALDALFYDVSAVVTDLLLHGSRGASVENDAPPATRVSLIPTGQRDRGRELTLGLRAFMLNTRLLYVGKKADFPVPRAIPWSGSRIGWGCEPPPQLLRVHPS